jgi:hypothetical protein
MSAFWAKAEITFVSLTDVSDTFTLKVTNRPAQSGDADHLPLLLSYSGLSLAVGQDGMPRSSSGSINISDDFQSLGYQRRVYDLFDRYTPQNQTITVYRTFDTVTETDLPSSWTLLYTGKVQSVSKGKDSLVFEVSNDLLPDLKISRSIDSGMGSFFNSNSDVAIITPENSLSKSLPFVFSDGINFPLIPCYPIGFGHYAFASTREPFTSHSSSSAGEEIVVQDSEGVYRLCFNSSEDYLQLGANGALGVTSHGTTEFLIPFDIPNKNYLFHGFQWLCKGQNNPALSPVGDIVCTFYRCLKGDVVATNVSGGQFMFSKKPLGWEALQTTVEEKSDYLTQLRLTTDFYVQFGFAEPIVCGRRKEGESEYLYGIGISLTNYSGSSTTDFTSAVAAENLGRYYYRTTTGGVWEEASSGVPRGRVLILNGAATSFPTEVDGNGTSYSAIEIVPTSYAPTKITNLDNLNIAIYSSGFKDNASGTITGSASTQITRPDHVIKFLTTKCDLENLDNIWGDEWTNGDLFDFSTYDLSSVFNLYYRRVIGFSQGDESLLDVITKLVKEMCCALVPLSSGKLAIWAWGLQQSVSKVFTDADIIEISDISETNLSTVINNIKIAYGENYTETSDQWEATGESANISGIIEANRATSGDFANLLKSYQIYGNRELEETSAQFIGDENTALTRAKYLAYRHDRTHRTFTLTVKLEDNESLKVMDIIDVLSVNLPAYFGTSNVAMLPTFDGSSIDIYSGEHPRRAQRRRCQIIGINNDYDGQFPRLQLEVREIKPRHTEDPTAEDI